MIWHFLEFKKIYHLFVIQFLKNLYGANATVADFILSSADLLLNDFEQSPNNIKNK